MKALTLARTGVPEDMSITDLPVPAIAPGHMRIRVEACGLNPSDFQRAKYGVPEWEWPAVLGLDPAGVVEVVGDEVRGFQVGDRIVAHQDIRARGGFAEQTIVSAAAAAVVPSSLSVAHAAAVPSAGLTAYEAIVRRLNVQRGDTVLITGAAGGIGGFAVQMAKNLGANVIGTDAGSNRHRVLAQGASHFIDYQTQNVVDEVRQVTGETGLQAVLDTVGTASATSNAQLLGFGGRIATTAGRPDISLIPPFTIGPSVHEIALGAAFTHGTLTDQQRLGTMLDEVLKMVAAGKLDPMLAHEVNLTEVPQTLGALSRNEVAGKAVYVASKV